MDMASSQIPYVLGAFIFASAVLVLLTFWSIWENRRVRVELKKWKSDEAEA